MKKQFGLVLVVLALLAGCSAAPSEQPETASASAASAETAAPAQTPETTAARTESACEIDLTAMSSTMVYSEVYQMLSSPEDYLGKTVRMRGSFSVYEGDTQNYYACLIADATACCAQGIEFVLAGDYAYPQDYPAPGEQICVEGVFDTYQEGQSRYCTLRDASFVD